LFTAGYQAIGDWLGKRQEHDSERQDPDFLIDPYHDEDADGKAA
jgi:hypothetical protein